MKLQSIDYQNQFSDKRYKSQAMSEVNRKVIRLHEVTLPENQLPGRKMTSRLIRSEESRPEKNSDLIVKKFLVGIVHYVNQNNFVKAEQLRGKFMAVAPTAVRAIAKAGEIIDQKKIACMDPEKIKPWADLFNQFSNSEAAAFYFALKDFVVKPNQPVFQQGNCDNRLYFICLGSLKLKYFDYDARKNVSITTLRKGDIAGIETFFTLTNHTTNLIAAEESKISFLEKSAYQKILAENYTIESKLSRYCETKQINYDQGKQEEVPSRRAYKRHKAELIGQVRRFDQHGKLGEEISKVKIIDISSGGLAYRVKNLKIGEASQLHNSRISIFASYRKYSLSYELNKVAKIVSLKFLPYGECSVHVQFEDLMDESKVMDIAQHADVTAYI